MCIRARVWGAVLLLAGSARTTALPAQVVILDGPSAAVLPTVTPLLQLRTAGLGPARPIQVTVQIASTADFSTLVLDSTFTTPDTTVAIQVTRPLPSEGTIYWRARVRALAGPILETAITGPRTVPAWLTLVTPNSPTGNSFDLRRPLLVWRSALIVAAAGPWRYDVEILSGGRPEVGVAGLSDTTFRPTNDLQANTSYRWSVRAWLRGGDAIKVISQGSFVITDPPLPTTTLLFQNFPNPFPTDASFATCFWFDVGEPGATIALDVLDLRGNLVRNIVPGTDGTRRFAPGRYGRGIPGASSNCDNRFVWDGTANDGRTVAPGVYLARFQTSSGSPSFRRIVFRGR